MADDLLLSPEEQDERARQWFKDNWLAIAIGIGLGLAAVTWYQNYKTQQQQNAVTASALYASVLDELASSDLSDITAQVDRMKADYQKTPYAAKVVLLKAKQLAATDMPAAYEELQWVVDNATEVGAQHTARIRQAKLKLAMGELDAAEKLANYSPTQGFDSHYQEVLGDINVRNGNLDAARANYDKAIESLNSEQSGYIQVLSLKRDRLPAAEAPAVAPEAEKSEEGTESAPSDS